MRRGSLLALKAVASAGRRRMRITCALIRPSPPVISASSLLASAFHLPAVDEFVGELMVEQPLLALALVSANVLGSTALIRFLFGNVLDFGRFRNKGIK